MPKLEFLGVGNSESLDNWNSNVLIETADSNILIDCGYTIKYALADSKRRIDDIDAIFITHIHGDHVFGLERIAFESRYKYNKRISLYIPQPLEKTIWESCLKGGLGFSSSGENQISDFFDVIPVSGSRFTYSGIVFDLFLTNHAEGKTCYGLVINGATVFTSDSNILPFLKSGNDYSLIIHDCTNQEGNPAHATFREICSEYPESSLKKMMLTHCDDSMYQERASYEDTGVTLATQGLVLEIP